MKKEAEMKKIIAILNKAYEGSAQSSSSSSEVVTPTQSSGFTQIETGAENLMHLSKKRNHLKTEYDADTEETDPEDNYSEDPQFKRQRITTTNKKQSDSLSPSSSISSSPSSSISSSSSSSISSSSSSSEGPHSSDDEEISRKRKREEITHTLHSPLQQERNGIAPSSNDPNNLSSEKKQKKRMTQGSVYAFWNKQDNELKTHGNGLSLAGLYNSEFKTSFVRGTLNSHVFLKTVQSKNMLQEYLTSQRGGNQALTAAFLTQTSIHSGIDVPALHYLLQNDMLKKHNHSQYREQLIKEFIPTAASLLKSYNKSPLLWSTLFFYGNEKSVLTQIKQLYKNINPDELARILNIRTRENETIYMRMLENNSENDEIKKWYQEIYTYANLTIG